MSRLNNRIVLMFAFYSISALCFEIFKEDDDYHECARPCSDLSSKKTCVYHFFVTESQDITSFYKKFESSNGISTYKNVTIGRSLLTINGKSPGPAIQSRERERERSQFEEQCEFRVAVEKLSAGKIKSNGTLVSQQADGVYGPLTVRGSRDDLSLERTLILSSRSSIPLTRHASLYPPTPGELLVNGQARGIVVRIEHGRRYLLRLINANAYDCPVLLSIHGHSLRIFAADGNPVQSMTGTHVVLFPGERLDGILLAKQAVGRYAFDIQGLRDCRNLRQEAYLLYENAAPDSYTMRSIADSLDEQAFEIAESGHRCHRISKNVICSLDLKSTKLSQFEEKADETIYVPFDTNTFSLFTDEMTDDSYSLYTSRYYPSYLSLKEGAIRIPQINGMSFKYPSSPILSQPENILEKSICSLNKRSDECDDTPLFCECLQLLQVLPRKTIEIVLINEGFGGNVSYTFHLHGYNASVISRESFEQPITKNDVVSLDLNGKIYRNFVNPVRKDTFVVPNKGYVILRFYTDNLGYWLWEARSTAIYPPLLGPGMQFVMRVGLQQNLPLVPINFPTCGNNKGMDLIFEPS
ncbi:laccase-9 [Pogonomyrmex barbatus]|uniref:Laccase-9 n=1 Tax=Pogonomyrmex barbatus TaxID=144034 RepID=A0A8N1S9T3_9HYME|nr:laccase-9 [Pogonomyrmex barbatus]